MITDDESGLNTSLVSLSEVEVEVLLMLLRESFIGIMEGGDTAEVQDDLLPAIIRLQIKLEEALDSQPIKRG